MANVAPNVSDFCTEQPTSDTVPVIRFPGGMVLEPQIDPNKGMSECAFMFDLTGRLQTALAPFQPLLTIMDLVASLGQAFLILVDCVTNPLKILDLIPLIPGLVSKINSLLALIPAFPQGIQAFVTFIVDVINFVGRALGCIVTILKSIQAQLDELARIADAINTCDDDDIRAGLQAMFDCGQKEAEAQTTTALASLAPIARLLCTVRAILVLIPGGAQIQKSLAFPDPSTITDLRDAIAVLETIRDVLLGVVETVTLLTAGLGVLPLPAPGFRCPLDEVDDTPATAAPEPEPQILDVQNGTLASIVVPGIPQGTPGGPAFTVVVVGSGFTSRSRVFWATSQIPVEQYTRIQPNQIVFEMNPDLRLQLGSFMLTVANIPESSGGAFSGLAASAGGTADTGVVVSAPVFIAVV